MDTITVRDVTAENLADLEVCIPRERRGDLAFVAGMHEKRQWAVEMLRRWGTFAKIAYRGAVPAGLLQHRPIPADHAIFIYCIYVPERTHWQQGVASRLLDGLIGEMREPQVWFDYRPARLLVTRTFSGERAGQLSARSFFLRRGFRPAADDAETLYFPLAEDVPVARVKAIAEDGAAERFFEEPSGAYVPQAEDRKKAIIIYGPSSCPFTYNFWLRAESQIKEIAPDLPIRWINTIAEPAEVERRGGFAGCVVNATPIKSFVLDRDGFQREVRQALGPTQPD